MSEHDRPAGGPEQSGRDQLVSNYVERLLALDQQRQGWLSAGDLDEIARELGLSDEALADVERTVAAYRERGENFLRRASHSDAIDELSKAAALRPFDVELSHLLARAYRGRFTAAGKAGDLADREAARTQARHTIELDPKHEASYELLLALDRPVAAAGRPWSKYVVAVVLVFGVAGAAAVFGFLISRDQAPPEPSSQAVISAPQTATEAADDATGGVSTIPATLVADERSRGLTLRVQRSVLNHYSHRSDAYSYELHGSLFVTEDEVHALRIAVELLDASGAVLHVAHTDVVRDFQPYMHPGLAAPVRVLVFKEVPPPAIHSARVRVDHIERKDAAASYPAADPLPLTWASRQPANIAIAVRLRDERLTESLAKQLHFLTLTVENTGARAIDLLRLRVSWFDSSGREVGSKLDFVALRSGPHLPPGETWAVRVIGEFPESAQEPFESFAVTVVEAE